MNDTQFALLQEALDIAPKLINETFRFKQETLANEYLYYYTTVETFVNGIIIDSPEPNKELCIWATRWSHMNDKREVKSGLDLLRACNMPLDIVKFQEDFVNNLHVICFSENKDNLQMWNGYGKRGYGVMLAFDFKELSKFYPNLLKPCIYENTQLDSEIINKIFDCDFSDDFNALPPDSKLIASYLCMIMYISLRKNNAYTYENEIRLTGIGLPILSPHIISKYRVQDGLIIPYIPVYFPKSILKQVWLGPCLEHERNKVILEEILKLKGFKTEVVVSDKPYRG